MKKTKRKQICQKRKNLFYKGSLRSWLFRLAKQVCYVQEDKGLCSEILLLLKNRLSTHFTAGNHCFASGTRVKNTFLSYPQCPGPFELLLRLTMSLQLRGCPRIAQSGSVLCQRADRGAREDEPPAATSECLGALPRGEQWGDSMRIPHLRFRRKKFHPTFCSFFRWHFMKNLAPCFLKLQFSYVKWIH